MDNKKEEDKKQCSLPKWVIPTIAILSLAILILLLAMCVLKVRWCSQPSNVSEDVILSQQNNVTPVSQAIPGSNDLTQFGSEPRVPLSANSRRNSDIHEAHSQGVQSQVFAALDQRGEQVEGLVNESRILADDADDFLADARQTRERLENRCVIS